MHAVLPGRRPGAGGGSRASRSQAQRDNARALARLPAAPRASGPSRLALHQRPRAPALLAASQWETCCQAESSFEWPNQAPQPEPLLIWGPGDELANPPPRHRRLPRPLPPRSTAHPRLRPRPLPQPRAERGKSAQRRAGGQTGGGRWGGAPLPGALPAGGRAGSWSGKFQAGGRVSPALPSHTAPQRRFSPPPDSSWREPASLYGRHPGRAAGRELCSPPWTLPAGAAAPRSGTLGCPRRGRAAPFGDPRCAPAAGLSAHCSSGPSLSPPSSASRPSLLPPQVPPSSSPALYKSPAPADPPAAGDPGTLAPGAGSCRRLRTAGTLRSRR